MAVGRPAGRDRRWPLWWHVSAALGATTHVVWDAFTHLDRWGTRVLPVLGERSRAHRSTGTRSTGVRPSRSSSSGCSCGGRCASAAGRADAADGPWPPSGGERWLALALIGGCAAGCGAVRVVRWLSYVDGAGLAWRPWEIVPTVCFGRGRGSSSGSCCTRW